MLSLAGLTAGGALALGLARLHYSPTHKATTDLLKIAIDDDTGKNTHRYCITTAKMRTYDDTFSGQKIYPGKVRCHFHLSPPYNPSAMLRQLLRRLADRMRMEDIGHALTKSFLKYRASSTSVVTAKSSDSRMARPKAFSSSERTHVGSPGRRCSGGSTRRVSLRLVAQEHLCRIFAVRLEVDIRRCNKRVARISMPR